LVAGVDEAGRGALAGPVVAAAVILPDGLEAPWLSQVRDSKQLTPTRRRTLFGSITLAAVSLGIGVVSHRDIDDQGIAAATRLAMKRAIAHLSPPPDWLLIDYLSLPEINLPQKGITNGDCHCLSIACASVVAKVARDRIMVRLAQAYPEYGFSRHKGYGTAEHLSSIRRQGPCPVHRGSFQPVRDYYQGRLRL